MGSLARSVGLWIDKLRRACAPGSGGSANSNDDAVSSRSDGASVGVGCATVTCKVAIACATVGDGLARGGAGADARWPGIGVTQIGVGAAALRWARAASGEACQLVASYHGSICTIAPAISTTSPTLMTARLSRGRFKLGAASLASAECQATTHDYHAGAEQE